MDSDLIYKIATWILPVLLAITLHEYAHGWAANKLGDSTAKMLGRLTINPIKHIDPVGTLLIPGLLILMSSPFLFGYAKPIPVNVNNLKEPRRDMALVAIAGPIANLAMAFAWGFIILLGIFIIMCLLSIN
jgi:Zn-dependent protease